MILLNLNGRQKEPELICPHCEKPMSEHGGVKECGRSKVSRRFFMGGLGMAAAGTAAGLAFTKKAEAALADAVEIKSTFTNVTGPEKTFPESLFEVREFAPKVHRGGPIIITHNGGYVHAGINRTKSPDTPSPQFSIGELQAIANREGRDVIFKSNAGVRVAKPSERAWSDKWESPSLAHYDGK